ncbi:hypothetical protein F4861DRAFT_512309 [Xylaria intraflava]|nr:hypothetical protein F4861DRAFT_512309 [Xylaria intraflava]
MFLNVNVSGGQQAYIGPDGALAYTQAHSSVPPGSFETGFGLRQSIEPGEPTYLTFEHRSWYLCVAPEYGLVEEVYQVYGIIPPRLDCVSSDIRAYRPENGTAWQYT